MQKGRPMPADMRSIVYLGPKHIELRRVSIPHPKAGELLVKVRAATTCGTDVKTYLRGHPKFPAPFAFGHEFGGDVVEVGQGVSGFQPGMRVTANVFAECGECFYCRLGQGNLCENLVYNFGAFSEYMIFPKSIVRLNTFEIPAQITYSQAAIVEPLVTVVHGQHLVKIQPGEHVASSGVGRSACSICSWPGARVRRRSSWWNAARSVWKPPAAWAPPNASILRRKNW